MGTRGAFGIRKDGVDKIAYNQCDSYPTGLGADMCRSILFDTVRSMKEKFDKLRVVQLDTPVTEEDIEKLKHSTDLSVSGQSTKDWYCLVRKNQGDLTATLNCGYILDGHKFLENSLFCEYAYIVNLDAETLECYEGFQKSPGGAGRYAKDAAPNKEGYYPVTLVAEIPFKDIPKDDDEIASLMTKAYGEGEDEE